MRLRPFRDRSDGEASRMSWSLVVWVLLIGAPLVGILAVTGLVMFHEHAPHSARGRSAGRVHPATSRRAPVSLLDEYLEDERGAAPATRRARQASLLHQTARASTLVLDEYLEERAKVAIENGRRRLRPAYVAPPPARQRLPAVTRDTRPALSPAFERAPRQTRLAPLGAEIAVG